MPKIMIHETIRNEDDATELETHFNCSGSVVLFVSQITEPEIGCSPFVFESPEDIDWLVKRLRTLASQWRSAQEVEADNGEEVDQ